MDKFLKLPSTENGHISHLVTQYGLAFPEVEFHLIINGRTSFRSPGNGSLRDVLSEVYGLETAQGMLELGASEGVEGPMACISLTSTQHMRGSFLRERESNRQVGR
ncbi:hypothetical protein M1O57_05575 [Dehalococcoidia bacterium]|nr:hypothetical protein [Dehalococcoidia bacterium]MCL0063794.1 hypothetical protein [Dehalococcoidia bacterium]MCL0092915.1 hypothetical protein [Dehalococcoidia bacterium]MCL0105038.1 hypothetical protein [Dehalococcoidia bacterium]